MAAWVGGAFFSLVKVKPFMIGVILSCVFLQETETPNLIYVAPARYVLFLILYRGTDTSLYIVSTFCM